VEVAILAIQPLLATRERPTELTVMLLLQPRDAIPPHGEEE